MTVITRASILTLMTLLVGQCSSQTQGLTCYWCTNNQMQTDNPVINTFLSLFNKLSDEHCKLTTADDRTEVSLRQCPQPAEGNVMRCTVINGTVTAALSTIVGNVQIKFHTLTRDCVEVTKGTEQDRGGCYDDLPSDSTATNVLNNAFQSLSLGDVSFRGESCYYSDLTSSAGVSTSSILVMVTLLLSSCFFRI